MSQYARVAITAISIMMIFGLARNTGAAIASATTTVHQDALEPVNDLHVTYESDVIMNIISHKDGPFPNFTATPFDAGHGMKSGWECTWSGAWISFCTMVTVGVEFDQQGQNTIKQREIYFTIDNNKASDYLPMVGFNVTPEAGRADTLIFTLTNNTTVPVVVTDAEFGFQPELTPLDSMMYGMTILDIPGPVELSLNPDDSFQIALTVPPALYGNDYFVMAQGLVNGPTGDGQFVHQHEHPVSPSIPALTEWSIGVLIALLSICAAIIVMRKRNVPNSGAV
jgi:hypothetical protein